MWPFRRSSVIQNQHKPKSDPERITFHRDDDCYKRAENIWKALGFVNDRFGAIPQMAYYLTMYRDWDRDVGAEEMEEANGSPGKLRKRK
jgi:hypothetical protein